MKRYLPLMLMGTLMLSPAASADNHKDGAVTPGDSSATDAVGEAVPQMKNDEKPAKESTAPDKQTYTDEVGKAVPDMKAPKKDE